ncbi:hypothetical protein O3P69_010700 [Scylla paramamosain]|uniref:Transposase n=1 Tax=Scylla paramamosain TaxID=85552 RepID=A0AAW0THP5_SCYPA
MEEEWRYKTVGDDGRRGSLKCLFTTALWRALAWERAWTDGEDALGAWQAFVGAWEAVHRKKRLAFVQKYSSWTLDEWRRVLWTDEATFRVSDTKGKKVWRRKGSDPHDPKFTARSVKHPPSLMAWGAFSYGGRG